MRKIGAIGNCTGMIRT